MLMTTDDPFGVREEQMYRATLGNPLKVSNRRKHKSRMHTIESDDDHDGDDDDGDANHVGEQTGDERARTVLEDTARLVDSDRDTHGDAVENQEHIARGWTWYLRGQGVLAADEELTGGDVGRMMALLKLSRTAVGDYDVDHDRDVAGYAGIAAACEHMRGHVEQLTVDDIGEHE